MKKYITIAALLAAGTAFANAGEETFVWTPEDGDFSGFKLQSGELVTITGDFTLEFVVKATTRDSTFNVTLESENGTELGLSNFHGSNSYELNWFKTTPGDASSHVVSLGGHFSDARIVSSPATFVFDFTKTDNGYYNVSIVGSNTEAGWSESWSYTGYNISGLSNGDQNPIVWNSLETSATAVLSSMKLTTNVPEPSAFGLLAGIGALALVASRRRKRA